MVNRGSKAIDGNETGSNAKKGYEFRFVETEGPSGKIHGESLTAVRAHVRRDLNSSKQKQRVSHQLLAAHPKPGPAEGTVPQNQRFRLGPGGLKETKKRNRKGKDPSKEPEKQPSTELNANSIKGQRQQCNASSNHSNLIIPSKDYDTVASRARQYKSTPFVWGIVEGPGIDSLPRSADAGHGVLDPFGVLPIIVCHRVQTLLYQGQFVFIPQYNFNSTKILDSLHLGCSYHA